MWYKNIAGRFFGLVTKHACDRQTEGRTDRIKFKTPKTVVAQLHRAVKTLWMDGRTDTPNFAVSLLGQGDDLFKSQVCEE